MVNSIQKDRAMAGNEWINGYLEAILDAGTKLSRQKSISSTLSPPAGRAPPYSPTKYFVEEVVNHFDDADLHKTWIKAVAMRSSHERNQRLENICWRIWHLTRKKKQIEWEDERKLAKQRMEREQLSKVAAEDLSDLSEGEKEKGDAKMPMLRIDSNVQIWQDEQAQNKRLYIVLISLHGLIRGENMELGRDSDTGGQVKYVVELARALGGTKGVYRVDLLTRQISGPDVHWSYGEPVEMLTYGDRNSHVDSCGAYIIRLPFGPGQRYIPKETLWPHIPEFVDRALAHITNVARSLGDQLEPAGGGKPIWPYVIHGHYADASEAAAHLSGILNVPMVITGHSLGRNKLEQLLKQGRLSKEDINRTYRIMRRIEAEEAALDAAVMVITSTRQEIDEQWGLYDGFDVNLERKLRVRRRRGVSCFGRYMPRMVVIPPGLDFSYVHMQDLSESDADLAKMIGPDGGQSRRDLPPIWDEIMRFFTNPHKPMILALSRPDPKKNVTTLLKAFGECRPLQELANMTLILGNRDDIEEMSGSGATVLTTVLKLIDKYDLYGLVAYPKHHKQTDVPEIYRLAAKTKGVFINPALVEPFGLTLIEAAAYGLPVVATKNGGPVDIVKALNNGVLVDPHDHNAISAALLKLVADKGLWMECRRNGLKNIHRFSWPEHCRKYLSHVEHYRSHQTATSLEIMARMEEPMSDSLRDVEDLSLRFSVDGGDLQTNGGVSSIVEALHQHRHDHTHSLMNNTYMFGPGKRQRMLVIAVDCYDTNGLIVLHDFSVLIRKIMAIGGTNGCTGFVLATGATGKETIEAMQQCDIPPRGFDALICSSGSELYYPWRDLMPDGDYGVHIDYRWPAEHVKSTILRVAQMENNHEEDCLIVDEEACSWHCNAYSLKQGAKVRKVDAIRQRLRMRGFRCNPIYTKACTRLNVVPLFASRSFALRYLSVIWNIDLSKVLIFVGERGDTDHEELLPGIHNTVILTGLVTSGSESLLSDEENFKIDDIVPFESSNIAWLPAESFDDSAIMAIIENVKAK
ncbi:Sucrose-phosphate synthase plant protein [Dioscorea alata]|uniref:Sucrose-phosphate synthase plant protein n=1 Tax=Dioscorea alata TaxID=55571 RepID=A0ACB7VB21_DIOAL|nr:Sucrose-phosphate synthase plant protein [Dioscorea alata]